MKLIFGHLKNIFLFLAPLLIFSSCTKNSVRQNIPLSDFKGEITLALRSGTYSDVIKKCIPEFEQTHKIHCNVLEFGEDALHSAITEDSENKYDFCMVDGSWMAEFTADGILANLSELDYELDDDIIPATKTICYHNGSLYLAPYYGNVTVILYNKIMIKEAGFKPEEIDSLDDILKICRFQKKRHNLGFMYRGDTNNNIVVDFLPILASRGAWVVDKNNFPTINTIGFSDAMESYMDLLKTGRAAKKEDLIAAIANKSAAIGIGWPGWYTPTKNSSMDYIAFSGKFHSDLPVYNSNIYGIWAVGIPQKSTKKNYAIQLLKYLMDKDVQKTTVEYGGVPCRYSSLSDEAILKKFPQYNAVREALENGIYRPVMQTWPQFYTILGTHMRRIINGEISISNGLTQAQMELEKLQLSDADKYR
ncbi:extracellular solute-binding protein [Treponema zioleckii]|uniref:extracellular solute-binding protein n=1 Tax=Treponema zioleckii TaxID=331680 RepID=UPI00168A6F3E|nr:extracellular solute-binding protein [Treponema zioleckii]